MSEAPSTRRGWILSPRAVAVGFFLEYECETETPGDDAVKLAACFKYRDSCQSQRYYNGLTVLLVVTIGPVIEAQSAVQAYLGQHRRAPEPVGVFQTTTERAQTRPDGILGPIWRTRGLNPCGNGRRRVSWLPGLGARAFGQNRQATARATNRQELQYVGMTAGRLHG